MQTARRKFNRVTAAIIAFIAWLGLAVQFGVVFHQYNSVSLSLWIIFAYFTITTNLLIAVVFTSVALDRSRLRADWVIAGSMLSILLVGVIYGLLLHGSTELSGGSAVANILLHMVTPAIVVLYWLILATKGSLNYKQALVWAVYPLLYFVYALSRGAVTGKYPYPFLNVAVIGWERVFINAFLIAAVFILASMATVWIDHRIAARQNAQE